MKEIFICEDDLVQLIEIEKYIKNYILIQDYNMKFVFSSVNPYEILDYIESKNIKNGVFSWI